MAATGMQPSSTRAAEVRPDQHRPPAQPVDPRAGDEPDDERRDQVEAAQHRDLDRPGAERQDRHERQRDPGDEAPKTEIVAAVHTRTNAPLRHRPGVGVMSWVGGTGSSSGSEVTARRVPVREALAGRAHAPPTTIEPGAVERAMTYTPSASVSPEPAHHPPAVAARPDLQPTARVRRLRMFDSLSDRLRKTLASLTGRGRMTEADVDAAMREVRLALLEADVNFKVVKDFVARVRERAVGAEILESLTAGQQVVKIVNEELTALLSAGDRTFHLSGNPAVVALVGLQGSGKTTSAAKLAKHVVKLGRRPLLVAADPYRPGRRRPARDARQVARHRRSIARPVGTPDRRHRPRRHRGREAPGPRRRDPRHRRPAHDRRGADGRDPRRSTPPSSRSRRCSSSTR